MPWTDEKERKGGLRLDLESHAYKAGKSGFEAIIRGNSKDSEIITRIHLPEDDSEHIPPPESGKSLTEEQKKILAKWIDQEPNTKDTGHLFRQSGLKYPK